MAFAVSADDKRWEGVSRLYTKQDVEKLRGSLKIEHTLARHGAERLWKLLHTEPYIHALGALTGNQAVQQVQAGLKAIYLSGWQVAGDANTAMQTYPDQSLYPADSVPKVIERINNAFIRADQIQHSQGKSDIHWFAPIVADAEAGFGGNLNAYELMRAMIKAGAAGVHFEDQLASAKKCGHMGGKVLVPTSEFVQKLQAARLAADVSDVPSIIIARTDALGAYLLTSDIDDRDKPFCTGGRTSEGFFQIKGGIESAIARGLAYAPYADLVWFETGEPSLEEATAFAKAMHEKFPGKLLAYNCSPSFNWKKKLDDATIAKFQATLGALGYKFQFVTLAGFHALNFSMFTLAHDYASRGMAAYAELQAQEFAAEKDGYTATRHQGFVGTGYFDDLAQAIAQGQTGEPSLEEATAFAKAMHEKFPGKLLAYNCSPSFNWKKKLDDATIAKFQATLGALGYKFQFVTLAGFHALNFSMFTLAHDYASRGMAAYAELQAQEFAAEKDGYTATRHQGFVGTGYFDDLAQAIAQGQASTTALTGSTEEEQF